MKTEISRDSYQLKKRYSGVYQQQGRMLTDADWNELVEILKQRLNESLKDVVGIQGGSTGGTPRHRALELIDDGGIKIHPGHIYVNGVAAEFPGDTNIAYDEQADFPLPPSLPNHYVLYADVWERTVTHLMDEHLRDLGLHGADTCTRKQTMVQIKGCAHTIDPEQSALNPNKGDAELTVILRAASIQPDVCDPCASQLDVESRIGNYLFRVEVHDVKGNANKPSDIILKWSSENGAEQFKVMATKEEMPVGFVDSKFVYEFFNETSEKHLGVHLKLGGEEEEEENNVDVSSRTETTFLVRDVLHKDYPATAPDGFDFVRRWDGYAWFKYNTNDNKWSLDKGRSDGLDLTEDSSSTKAEKVLPLASIELKQQMLNRIIGQPVESEGLIEGSLVINEENIGSAGPSAKEKAAAIDVAPAPVTATANTVLQGIAPSETGIINAGQLKINGDDIVLTSAPVNVNSQTDAVVNAINTQFLSDANFTASISLAGAIVLTATDGRNLVVEVINDDVSKRCGFETGSNTYYGRITIFSPKNAAITIAGEHPEFAGFTAGTTLPVQFVAGDYWLAEVRESEHKAGSVLIENRAPQGIEHQYLTLGEVKSGELQVSEETDRKYAFPSLTEMTHMFIAGGDGQEAMPGHKLLHPIEVAVANGEWWVKGVTIRFSIEAGAGELSKAMSFTMVTAPLDVKTDGDGIARCYWEMGTVLAAQRIKATLIGRNGVPVEHPPVFFNANLSTAENVAFTPDCTQSTLPTVHSLFAGDDEITWPGLHDGHLHSTVKDVLDTLLCKLRAKHLPYNDPSCDPSSSVTVKSLLAEIGLDFDKNGHLTVSDVLDTLLCELKANHIPFYPVECDASDLTPTVKSGLDISENTNVHDVLHKLICQLDASTVPYNPLIQPERWEDINEEEKGVPPKPQTVQDALDYLVKNLESSDFFYTPGCNDETLPSVRSQLDIPLGTASKVDSVLNKLLCDLNATHLPIAKDGGKLCERLSIEGIDTIQDALNNLCQRETGGGLASIVRDLVSAVALSGSDIEDDNKNVKAARQSALSELLVANKNSVLGSTVGLALNFVRFAYVALLEFLDVGQAGKVDGKNYLGHSGSLSLSTLVTSEGYVAMWRLLKEKKSFVESFFKDRLLNTVIHTAVVVLGRRYLREQLTTEVDPLQEVLRRIKDASLSFGSEESWNGDLIRQVLIAKFFKPLFGSDRLDNLVTGKIAELLLEYIAELWRRITCEFLIESCKPEPLPVDDNWLEELKKFGDAISPAFEGHGLVRRLYEKNNSVIVRDLLMQPSRETFIGASWILVHKQRGGSVKHDVISRISHGSVYKAIDVGEMECPKPDINLLPSLNDGWFRFLDVRVGLDTILINVETKSGSLYCAIKTEAFNDFKKLKRYGKYQIGVGLITGTEPVLVMASASLLVKDESGKIVDKILSPNVAFYPKSKFSFPVSGMNGAHLPIVEFTREFLGISKSGDLTGVSVDLTSLKDLTLILTLDGHQEIKIYIAPIAYADLKQLAEEIQAQVRKSPVTSTNLEVTNFTCEAIRDQLVMTSGSRQPHSSVVVGSNNPLSKQLRLGISSGGQELKGAESAAFINCIDLMNGISLGGYLTIGGNRYITGIQSVASLSITKSTESSHLFVCVDVTDGQLISILQGIDASGKVVTPWWNGTAFKVQASLKINTQQYRVIGAVNDQIIIENVEANSNTHYNPGQWCFLPLRALIPKLWGNDASDFKNLLVINNNKNDSVPSLIDIKKTFETGRALDFYAANDDWISLCTDSKERRFYRCYSSAFPILDMVLPGGHTGYGFRQTAHDIVEEKGQKRMLSLSSSGDGIEYKTINLTEAT